MESNPGITPRRQTLLRWAAVAFVLGMVAWRWDSQTGFTALLRFGDSYAATRLPGVAALPLESFPGSGYDGQFYAQLAVRPDPRDEALQAALDNPRYRARRILLPGVAHVLGAGKVALTLNLYALLNVAAWLVLGWRLWRLVSPDAHGTAVWLVCLLSIGALDSVRQSLTDLPAMLLIVLAVEWTLKARRIPVLVALGLAGLTRETSVLATALPVRGGLHERSFWRDLSWQAPLVVLPLIGWMAWLHLNVPAGNVAGGSNFDWPGFGLARHLLTSATALASGDFDSRHGFGLLAVFSFGWQAVVVLHFWRWDSPWARLGLPFALLFWFLGEDVWRGYWAVARTCLPLTFAFNFLLPRDRWFKWHLVIGNVTLLHGVWRMLPD